MGHTREELKMCLLMSNCWADGEVVCALFDTGIVVCAPSPLSLSTYLPISFNLQVSLVLIDAALALELLHRQRLAVWKK